MKGTVFDIQKSSLVDGDGVRTVIFFKGCNLMCKWCHNPEGIKSEKELLFYKDRCIECGKCGKVCLNFEKKCTLCGICALMCPQNARELCGKDYEAEELLEIIKEDTFLYEQTGGGVTFSGGECMLQIDFLKELVKGCHEMGINTAVDTAGNVPFEYFEKIMPYVDTFLYDVKCVNDDLHKQFTGVSNKQILENLNRLANSGKRIEIRIPVVCGFNANDEEINRIFELLNGKNIHRVRLLPYHRLGIHKYEGVGRAPYEFSTPTANQMEKYEKMLGELL